MGGTKRVYDDSDLIALCGACHAKMHHLKEA
jgi:predicted HNH restriction endonuclease